jgi:hypothetical protein
MAQEPEAQDLVAIALDRVITQYRGKPKLAATIEANVQPIQEMDDCALSIPPLYDIDTATSVNLDILGKLVGQGRILVNGAVVNDAQFRLLIRARIARNGSHATGEDLIGELALIFPGAPVRLFDFEHMTIGYLIGVVLTADEIAVLSGDILPRPMGVQVKPRGFYDPAAYFGFADDPSAKGFADDTIRGPGKLAEGF